MNTERLEKLIAQMSDEDLCGQLLNYNIPGSMPLEEVEEMFKTTRPGGVFFGGGTRPERIREVTALANQYAKAPVIVSADIENGPGCCVKDAQYLPFPMAWGAADDEALIERAGELTGEICRKAGVHWSFAPLVDINYNKDNPVVNVRAISDSPKQVAKMAGAYVRGMQKTV